MKAAYLEATGGPEVIQFGDLPTPKPGPGECLVKVKVSALNPIDVYIRAGTVKMPLPIPFVTGTDVAGVVEAVGPGVLAYKPGDRVWGSNLGLLGRQGACAEYVNAPANLLYPIPDGVDDVQAAAVALVGITAHLGLIQRAKLQPGETVFVHGGTGGVGSMVSQMAKALGAKVITTVGSTDKAKLCQSWGIDLVLNYKTDDLQSSIREFTQGRGVNVWYETQREPNFLQAVEMLAPNGRMIIMAGRQAQPIFPVGPFYVKGLSLFGFAMFNASPEDQRQAGDDINRWLQSQQLRAPIGKSFPLVQTAEAHRFLEENTLQKVGTLIGKIVITP